MSYSISSPTREEHNLTSGYETVRRQLKRALEQRDAQLKPWFAVNLCPAEREYGEDINALKQLGYAQ